MRSPYLSHRVALTPLNDGGKRAQRYQYTSKSDASKFTRWAEETQCPAFFFTGRDVREKLQKKYTKVERALRDRAVGQRFSACTRRGLLHYCVGLGNG